MHLARTRTINPSAISPRSLSVTRFPPFFAQTDVKWVRSGGTVAPSLLPSLFPAASSLLSSLPPLIELPSSSRRPFSSSRRHVILIAYIHISGSGDILGGRKVISRDPRPSRPPLPSTPAIFANPRLFPFSSDNLTTSRLVARRGGKRDRKNVLFGHLEGC